MYDTSPMYHTSNLTEMKNPSVHQFHEWQKISPNYPQAKKKKPTKPVKIWRKGVINAPERNVRARQEYPDAVIIKTKIAERHN